MGGLRKVLVAATVVIAGVGATAALAPAAGAMTARLHRSQPVVDHMYSDGGVDIGLGSVQQLGRTAKVAALVNAGGLAPGDYRVNLVYGSTQDIAHPHVRNVCKLVIGTDGSGWCGSIVHAQTDAPGVNALAVTITKAHGPIDEPAAVTILRFG